MADFRKDLATHLGSVRDSLRRAREVQIPDEGCEFDLKGLLRNLRAADNCVRMVEVQLASAPTPKAPKEQKPKLSASQPSQARESSLSDALERSNLSAPKVSP